jgi:hypothetical protein
LLLKQIEGEALPEYTKCFKTARDVLESHIGGPIILTKYMKTMSDYDAKFQRKWKYVQNNHSIIFWHLHIWIMQTKQNMDHYYLHCKHSNDSRIINIH